MTKQEAVGWVQWFSEGQKPQQKRAAVNLVVRRYMSDLIKKRKHKKSKAFLIHTAHDGQELGRWLAKQVGESFNGRVPKTFISEGR